MLFLGAGASRAFGLPDLSEITDIVMNDLSQYTFFNKIQELKAELDKEYKELTKTDENTDIEILLTILNIINSNDQIIVPSPITLLIRNLKSELGKLNDKELIDFRNKIVEIFNCKLHIGAERKELVDKITLLYDDLFSIPRADLLFSSVVTTNYDNTFEIFSRNSKQPEYMKINKYISERGFKWDGASQKFCLHTDPNTQISFLKLHGSLDWWIDESGTEITKPNG